jgi:transposase
VRQCGGSFSCDAERELIGEYDEIEIPPVKPYVVRHRRYACRCEHCGLPAKAPAPAIATTTPFGPLIHALAIYLKLFQALSYERLRGMFSDAFGIAVSEGTLMNMFIRSHGRFEIEAQKAKPFSARPTSSPATKREFESKGRTRIIGCFTARTRSYINPTIPARPASWRK